MELSSSRRLQSKGLVIRFAICKLSDMKNTSPLYANLRALGISRPYASQISGGSRKPSLGLALRLYREFGTKIGPLENKTKREIETLERANDLLGPAMGVEAVAT